LLTSDEHMSYVAKQADKSNKSKRKNNKSVVAPDKQTVKRSRPVAQISELRS